MSVALFGEYPYLWTGVFVTVAALVLGTFFRNQRRMMLLAAATHAPFFWMVFTLEGSYWKPTRIGGGAVGIEDLLVGIGAGAIAWFLVSLWPFARYLQFELEARSFWKRYLILSIIGMAVFFGICFGFDAPMIALVLVLPIGTVIVLSQSPWLWRIAVAGMLGFALAWFLIAKTVFILDRGLLNEWNLTGPLGRLILGVPLGEILWAAGFGLAWPTFAAYLARARFVWKQHEQT